MPYLQMTDGTKIYYEDRGKGETLLFVHGLNSSHQKIKAFIDEFKGEYRCVCYDQRGHNASDDPKMHYNVKRLGQDMHELLEALDLQDVTVIGHSMGAAATYSYIGQYGCERLKRFVIADMSPYMRNGVWEGGIGMGKHTDEDFLVDIDRYFENPGLANWFIVKDMMIPSMASTPPEMEEMMITLYGGDSDANMLTSAAFWYSLFRTDQRPAVEKITVPVLYVMPEIPLYSTVATDYIKEHVKSSFTLVNDIPGTTHMILMEAPKETADRVKAFLKNS